MILVRLHRAQLAERVVELGTRICVVDYVAEYELIEPDGRRLRDIGLQVRTLSADSVAVALDWQRERPALSLGDVFSAALALENGYVLATHDAQLKRLCQDAGISVCGVADVMLTMAESELLCADDITRFKAAMRRFGYADYRRQTIKQAEKIVRSCGSSR